MQRGEKNFYNFLFLYNSTRGRPVGIKKSFDALTATVLSFLNFSHITTPLLISVIATITKNLPAGMTEGIPGIALELVKQMGSFATSQLLSNLIKGKSKEIKPKDLESIKNEIQVLSDKIETILSKNISLNNEIIEFVSQLVASKEFKDIIARNKKLEAEIGRLRSEIMIKFEQLREEISVITSVKLAKIDDILEKDSCKDPEFFRNAGPNWIDFEKGFVYERSEVNKIIKELKNKDIVVIKGSPASGKSVILRNIGYKLTNEGADVYYIDLGKFLENQVGEISKISQGYIIVDNVHLNINFIEHLLVTKPKAKVIMASRDVDVEKINGPDYKFTEFLRKAILIEGEKSARGIVHLYEQKMGEMPLRTRQKLTYNNLWILAWELMAYSEYKSIEHEKVLEKVRKYIERVKNFYVPNNIKNPEDVLLPLSIFYKYEIPVRKPFITEFADEDTIDKLLTLNEISMFSLNTKDYLTLHHSEIAEIYLKLKLSDLFNSIKSYYFSKKFQIF